MQKPGTAPNLTCAPNAEFNGSDSFTFKANDGLVDSDVATVSITVTAVNDPPVADDQAVTTAEDTSVAITLTASDADGDPLTYSIVTPPANGTLSGTAPNLTYAPNANYNGTDSFTYTANDGTADSNMATVTITVNPAGPSTILEAHFDADEDGFSYVDDPFRRTHPPRCQPTPPAAIHVANIEMSVERIFFGIFGRGRAEVTIVDQNGQPVVGATVEGAWSGLVSGTQSANTGTGGIAVLTSSWTWSHGTFTFTVQDVTASSYAHDPAANEETSDSISW
jgi:hypothetical protein